MFKVGGFRITHLRLSGTRLMLTKLSGTIIIIIMGLRSVSASKDVIGDPSRPGTNNSELLEPRREEREKALEQLELT